MRHFLSRPAALAALYLIAVGGTAAAKESKLADAAEHQDRTAVVALIKAGADVNVPQPDGATALHWAAHWNDVATAADLLQRGANPNAANDYGVTPLILAATNGSAEMIKALLKAGADPNVALATGQTPLMTAARTGNVAAVEALLGAGAAVEAKHATKAQTALMWAIAEHHKDAARALIDRGANIDARTAAGFTPLLFAAREGDFDTSRLLLAKGVDINESSSEGVTPLLAAIVRGHVDLAFFLLEHGAKPDGNAAVAGYTPLHWAATTFETSPITYPGQIAPGEWAAMSGIPNREEKIKLIKILLDHGAEINARATKRLLYQAGVPSAGMFLSSPGPGATPFFAAAASADAEMMRLLLAYGADPSIKSASGETALMAATAASTEVSLILTEAKRLEVVRLAWELGNDLEAADSTGHRAIHLAARDGLHDIISFLAEKGANLNSKTSPRSDYRGGAVPAQTALALCEGTVYGIHFERPATAEFLRKLGAKSEGHYVEPFETKPAAVVAPAAR
jgi:ankyrin repeat protein